jgi:hypothetical protein
MGSIFFIEFLEDIDFLKKIIKQKKKLIIISSNPNVSNELTKSNIKFYELNYFYNYKINYPKFLKKTLSISELIKKDFFSIYKNFHRYNWNIIEDFFYPIKICYDQLFYYTYCLDKILRKYNTKDIYVRKNNTVKFKDFIFTNNQSILYNLLNSKKNLRIKNIRAIEIDDYKNERVFSFGQIKKKFRNSLLPNIFLKIKLKFSKENIISLSSPEISSLIKKFPNYKKNIINLSLLENQNSYVNSKTENYDFIKKIKKNKKIKKFLEINHFDITKLFVLQIENISLSFDLIYKKFIYFQNLINKRNTKLIIFNTTAPFDIENIFFKKICDIKKIPKVVWCHGGYCSSHLEGYDVTDFKDSENQFSYGSFLQKITSDKNFLPKIIYKKKYNSYNIGSPFINLNFRPKNDNLKKKIIFIRGNLENYNQFYYPDCRGDKMSLFLELNINILNILKKYQHDYEIIFKDYPNSSDKVFWKNYLIKNGMSNMKYISDEKPLNQVLTNNQLVILPWLSTTFFQSLPYKNQIFVYEKSMFTKAFSQCGSEIKYFTKKKLFLDSLNFFLLNMSDAKFKHNTKSMKYFLNSNNPKNYKKSFDLAVKDIIRVSRYG